MVVLLASRYKGSLVDDCSSKIAGMIPHYYSVEFRKL